MTVSVYDRLDKTETGFVRAMARELIVARFGNHQLEESEIEDAIQIAIDLNELVKTLPTHAGLRNGTKYPGV